MGKLTAENIKTLPAGKHGDGDGLQLVISERGRGKWVLRYQRGYRAREMGLGAFPLVTLTAARKAALSARRLAQSGVDPIDEHQKETVAVPTFGKFAESVIEAQTVGVSAKHAAQWGASLSTYASVLLDRQVNSISIEDVLGVLKPIWPTKPETADRVRSTPRRRGSSEPAITRPRGVAISTTFWASANGAAAIMQLSTTAPCLPSSLSCARGAASRRRRSSSSP